MANRSLHTDEIFDLYKSYRDCMEKVFNFLRPFLYSEDGKSARSRFRSSADLLRTALLFRKMNRDVPSFVLPALEAAMRDRHQLLQVHMKLLEEDGIPVQKQNNEEYLGFIEKLEEIWLVLCPPYVHGRSGIDDSKTLSSNTLHPIAPSQIPALETALEDDEMGIWLELVCFVHTIESLIKQINHYWEEVSRGAIPVALAAWLSNMAFYAVRDVVVTHVPITPDAQMLSRLVLERKEKHPNLGVIDSTSFADRRNGKQGDLVGLRYILMKLQKERELGPKGMKKGSTSATERRDLVWDEILLNMRDLLKGKRAMGALEDPLLRSCEPLLPMLDQLLTGPKDAPISVLLLFGMQLLLYTLKAFVTAQAKRRGRELRLETLKLAITVQREIDGSLLMLKGLLIKSRKDKVIVLMIDALTKEYDNIVRYTGEQRFDLYYGTPWVAGAHMLEILDLAFKIGTSLCIFMGHLCAVLHLYNAMRHFQPEPLQRIPICDDLCRLFVQPLFGGELPTQSFGAAYKTVMQRLQAGRKKPNSQKSAGAVQLHPRSHLSFFHVTHAMYKSQGSHLLTDIRSNLSGRVMAPPDIRKIFRDYRKHPINVILEDMKENAKPQFDGDIPGWQLNYFRIFDFCIEFLKSFGAQLKEGDRDEAETVKDALDWIEALLDTIFTEDLDLDVMTDHKFALSAARETFKSWESWQMSRFKWDL